MAKVRRVSRVTGKVFEVHFKQLLEPETFQADVERAKRAVRREFPDVGPLTRHRSSPHPQKTETNVIWLMEG